MYIAINRFQIVLGKENDFEILWKERDTHLDQVPGFLKFHLIKGEKRKIIRFMLPIARGIPRMTS